MNIKQSNNRDASWDIVKAICIILMVCAHTGIPTIARSFIYMFHMAVFYFVAGYFCKVGGSNKDVLCSFFKRKTKALYKPYVIFALLNVWLHPLMYDIHWVESTYSFQEIARFSFKTLLCAGPLYLGAPMWFLKSLFISLGILVMILQLVKSEKKRALIVALLYCTGWTVAKYHVDVPWSLAREITVVSLLYLGYIVRIFTPPIFVQNLLGPKRNKLLVLFCFIGIMLYLARVVEISVQSEVYSFLGALPLFCLMGTFICKTIAEFVTSYSSIVTKCLSFVGRHTLAILMWHIIAMKIVSYFIVSHYNYPIDYLVQWTIEVQGQSWWCYIYSFVGVSVPLLFVMIKSAFTKVIISEKYEYRK